MSQNAIEQLPEKTVKLITSTQIVTSVGAAVKELIENSIDAGAKVIQVRLENYGLDLIEVKDDGFGISYDNVQKMFLPGYTSKIKQFEDLDKLQSYGFRGEALAAICKIANISITTKTDLDALAMTYEIDSNGLPVSSKPSHISKGTVISVSNLFSNLPVRRLFLSSKKKISEELKRTEQTVQSLSLIHPELGISLIHNKCPIWRKNPVKGIKQSFMQVAGLRAVSKMEYLNKFFNQISLDLIVPKKNLENIDNVFTNSGQSMYVYVNKRPVNCKILAQAVQEHIFHHYASRNISFKYAVCFVSVVLPPHQIDINLEPNKTKILFKNQTELFNILDEMLKNYYNHDFTCKRVKESEGADNAATGEEETEQQSKRPRLEANSNLVDQRNEMKEKSSDWDVEIILDDCLDINGGLNFENLIENTKPTSAKEESPLSLCSQINSNNCCLTSEEKSELNSILSETNHKLLVSKSSSNSETRLIDRNDIQSRVIERPILQEWPCRPKVVTVPQNPVASEARENDTGQKVLDEISKEVEKSAEQLNSESMEIVRGNKDEKEEDKKDESVPKDDNVCQFDLSMQSISSQMGKKEMKAFTKFARVMRPKILQEFPNLMFTQIAGILANRWKALSTDEVKYYEKMAEVIDDHRKIHQETKQNEKQKPQEKTNKHLAPPRNSSLKSMFENLKKKSKLSRPPRREISFPGSMDIVKNVRQAPINESAEYDFEVIGKLHPSGNWLFRKGKDIGHIRHQGLQELIASQKMLSSFSVPRKPLEKSIPVSEENLGTVLWNVLISLETESTSSAKEAITSDVIVKNGFLIELDKIGEMILSVEITEIAESIPHFGISELKDCVSLYQKNGEFGGLASWRPTSVKGYIINEAVRLAAQSSVRPPDHDEIEDMMNTYHLCFRHLPPLCLHSREIFPVIYNLENESSNI